MTPSLFEEGVVGVLTLWSVCGVRSHLDVDHCIGRRLEPFGFILSSPSLLFFSRDLQGFHWFCLPGFGPVSPAVPSACNPAEMK